MAAKPTDTHYGQARRENEGRRSATKAKAPPRNHTDRALSWRRGRTRATCRYVPMWQARFATPRAGELHLRPFLLGSTVCDCDHPAVAALSLELVGRCTSVAEAAACVRAWVREHIVYTLQDKSDLASQTLAKREGMCTNKANLQVALLRAAGIPGTRHATLEP